MRYNNYHKHTDYSNPSTQDCIVKIKDYLIRAKELGHTTYFTGEHGWQGDIYTSQTLCEEYGIKPIYSVEAYYVDDINAEEKDRRMYHLMMVAMTKKARYEINNILSRANMDGFYYKPRIDLNMLLSLTSSDTIITTACIAGRMLKGDVSQWRDGFMIPLQQHFGKNFFIEVQNHIANSQTEYNKGLIDVATQYDIPIIHANDSHYIYPEDSKYRDLYLIGKDMKYPEEDGFILDYPDYDEIVSRYTEQGVLSQSQIVEAINNTLIFDNAEPIYTDKEFKIPIVPNKFIKEELGDGYSNKNNKKVLQGLIRKGFKEKLPKLKKELIPTYKKEVMEEFDTIAKCGMESYFVLDNIAVNRAVNKYNGVLTRTGRGSAVSFITNYFLNLTEIDRIKAPTKLYPSRFMSAERILNSRSLPDIDLNWASAEPIIKATKDILGEDQVYYMLVYKPLKRSSAFRLMCKALGYKDSDYNEVGKLLANKKISDEEVIKRYPNWAYQLEESKKFRDVIVTTAPSPCSFLLSNDSISETVGIRRVGKEDSSDFEYCACIDGYNCDVYKYLKNDYLTVSVYSIISKVYEMIGRPIDDISTLINNCDDKVWNLYEDGITATLNQADSDAGRQQIMQYKPKNLAELAAWVAAIRPGAASLRDDFLNRKSYTTGVEELDDLLKDSYHRMLYQENIMTYLVWLGIQEKETYDIIKKISKKKFKEKELNELKSVLSENWIKKVGTEEGFEDTWKVVNDAASYSFNASHALSVATDSLYGAYLKANYPLEYYAVTLSLYMDDIEETSKLIFELPYFGINLHEPRFGKSGSDYTIDRDTNSITKGIKSIKYCNSKIAEELLDLSKSHYDSFLSLLCDIKAFTSINDRQLTILITLNFFSDFGSNAKLLKIKEMFDKFYKVKTLKKDKLESLGLTEYVVQQFADKETPKQYSGIDNLGLLNYLTKNIPDDSLPVSTQIKAEEEYLGYIMYTNPDMKDYYVVLDYKVYQDPCRPYFSLYDLSTGEKTGCKISDRKIYSRNPFGNYSIIHSSSFSKSEEKWTALERYEVVKR